MGRLRVRTQTIYAHGLFVDGELLANMKGMEFDPSPLQLIFNLIAITTITSLALYCFLLKRDKDRLIAELRLRSYQARNQPRVSALKEAPMRESDPGVAGDAQPVAHQDIREFVASRVEGWIARS